MGMNLKDFGTGSIELGTFLLVFATIACLSFIPVLLPILPTRVFQTRAIFTHSQRAGLLFGWFCLFHRKATNSKLWDSGISWDINWFSKQVEHKRNVQSHEWARTRAIISTALRTGHFRFFPRYWQGVLDEIFDIIDSPQWRRKDPNLHTA